jgi:hypothetical protein
MPTDLQEILGKVDDKTKQEVKKTPSVASSSPKVKNQTLAGTNRSQQTSQATTPQPVEKEVDRSDLVSEAGSVKTTATTSTTFKFNAAAIEFAPTTAVESEVKVSCSMLAV